MFSRWSRGETGLIYAKLMHMHPTYYHTSRTNVKILAPLSDARFSRTLDCPPSADSIVTFSTSFVWKKGGGSNSQNIGILTFFIGREGHKLQKNDTRMGRQWLCMLLRAHTLFKIYAHYAVFACMFPIDRVTTRAPLSTALVTSKRGDLYTIFLHRQNLYSNSSSLCTLAVAGCLRAMHA